MKIAIIGGGAAGCFCAVNIKRRLPGAEVTVYEAGARPMAKLAVTGGGRCNISNTFSGVTDLRNVYPRGFRLMRHALGEFSPEQTAAWWEDAGINLVEEAGGRLFPVSQNAMDVVRTLERDMRRSGVGLQCKRRIQSLEEVDADAVVVTTGGGLPGLLKGFGIAVEPAVPSLFTLKLADKSLRALSGTSIPGVTASLAGTSIRAEGDILLTDWGVSGPAILKLSSYAARLLSEKDYRGALLVNWLGTNEQECRGMLENLLASSSGRLVANVHPEVISAALWGHLLSKAGIREDARCAELGGKGINRIVAVLTADSYEITGRAAFKEEFVTCGGVAASAVDPHTLECRTRKGLFFAGEVLDIDGITGGFNLQAAWSTAMTVARYI